MPRRNVVLRRQARKVIYNVVSYMKKEAEHGVGNVKQIQKRAADATGVSIGTIQNIVSEAKKMDLVSEFRTPGKKRPRSKPITGLDGFDKGVVKRCIHNFHRTEKQMPTIKKLLAKLKRDINFQGGASSLSKIIKELGFRSRKTDTNKKVLIEKSNIRLKRIEYLEKLKKFREEGRPIVYTDKSYVHVTQTKDKTWTDGSEQRLKKFISKGQRIVIVLAGSEAGFVPDALLMFKSGIKSGDYHDDIDFNNYENWLQTKLIPNLNDNSVVVINNSPYHNKLMNPVPNSNSKKSDMELWLKEKDIPFDKKLLKPQLYKLICQHKDIHNKYLIDNMFEENNHTILRLPSYHSDLNPIEMALTAVKSYVASKNLSWSIDRTMDLIKEKVDLMGQQEWSGLYKKVKEVEEKYRQSDQVIDRMTDTLIIGVGDDTSSESDSESSCSDSLSASSSDLEDENVPSTSGCCQNHEDPLCLCL